MQNVTEAEVRKPLEQVWHKTTLPGKLLVLMPPEPLLLFYFPTMEALPFFTVGDTCSCHPSFRILIDWEWKSAPERGARGLAFLCSWGNCAEWNAASRCLCLVEPVLRKVNCLSVTFLICQAFLFITILMSLLVPPRASAAQGGRLAPWFL